DRSISTERGVSLVTPDGDLGHLGCRARLGHTPTSNVVNIRLVIGTALLIAPIKLDRRDIRRDLPFAVVAPLILGVLLWGGRLSRTDGAVLILVFAVWIGTTVLHALRERDATPKVLGTRSVGRAVALTFT